jgi:hypothetical protein
MHEQALDRTAISGAQAVTKSRPVLGPSTAGRKRLQSDRTRDAFHLAVAAEEHPLVAEIAGASSH